MCSPTAEQEREVLEAVRASPLLSPILERWDEIKLPDCWLAAGAVAQTIWNRKLGKPHDHGIRDIDLVYFDDADLSKQSEDAHVSRLRGLFPEMPVNLDVKNEARVPEYLADFASPSLARQNKTQRDKLRLF